MEIAVPSKIEAFYEKGFQLRFPGGSSRLGDIAAFGVLDRIIDEKKYSLFVFYNSILKKQQSDSLPEEKKFPEVAMATLEREFQEETGIKPISYYELGSFFFKDNPHTKFAFKIKKADESNVRIVAERPWLSTPYLIPLDYLLEDDRWKRIIYHTHHWIFEKAYWYDIQQRSGHLVA